MQESVRQQIPEELMRLLRVRRWNALGFFYTNFVVAIVAHKHFHATPQQMSLLFSLQSFGNLISAPISGVLADRTQLRRRLIFLGACGRGLSYFSMFLGILLDSFPLLVVGTGILGFCVSFFWNPMEALISDAVPYEHRAETFGIASQQDGWGSLIGAALGLTILGFFADSNPLVAYSPMLLFAFANAAAGFRAYQIVPLVPRPFGVSAGPQRTLKGYFEIPTEVRGVLLFILGFIVLLSVMGGMMVPYLQPYLINHITRDEGYLALAYAPGAALAMILAPKVGSLIDRMNVRALLLIANFFVAICAFGIPFCSNIYQVMALFLVNSIGMNATGLILAKILSEVLQNRRGSVAGARAFAANSGAAMGPWLGGFAWVTLGDRGPFLASAVGLLSVILIFVVTFPYVMKTCSSSASEAEFEESSSDIADDRVAS